LGEWHHFRAWALAQQRWKQRAIATALGVTEGAVSQWLKRAREGGRESLRRRIAPGPPHRLSVEQRAQLPGLLARGAEAFGFRGAVWTARRIASVIQREFGVQYHPSHVNRLVRALGLSVPVPEIQAAQRDSAKVASWFADHWPVLEKSLRRSADDRLGRRIRLLPPARPGPHVRAQGPRRRPRPPPPAPPPVRAILAQGGAQRIYLAPLPDCAPDTNPDEGIWRYLKRVELRNHCCHDLPELKDEFHRAVARLRHRRHILQACIQRAGYLV
jgi:transposase